ncbi:TrbI F-type domain-containing protein [Vibrio fluvialis]|uniref:TrbI F-type domain-containing protein n=1 Tax=Vibrio fluvialis TaxID=676 RepID=UPI0013026135|nr:TrbI F-type domain-containing protein [Vibrio fluvialis]
MKKKHVALFVLYTTIVMAGSVGASYFVAPKPEPKKEVVTVNLQSLIRAKAEALSKKESGPESSHKAQMEMAAYTEELNDRMQHIADDAGVIIFVEQAVLAGAYRDITPLLAEK